VVAVEAQNNPFGRIYKVAHWPLPLCHIVGRKSEKDSGGPT